MHEAEELAEEDMLWFLTEDPRGKESVEQKAKELRAEARERRKAFQDQSVKFHGGLVSPCCPLLRACLSRAARIA